MGIFSFLPDEHPNHQTKVLTVGTAVSSSGGALKGYGHATSYDGTTMGQTSTDLPKKARSSLGPGPGRDIYYFPYHSQVTMVPGRPLCVSAGYINTITQSQNWLCY